MTGVRIAVTLAACRTVGTVGNRSTVVTNVRIATTLVACRAVGIVVRTRSTTVSDVATAIGRVTAVVIAV